MAADFRLLPIYSALGQRKGGVTNLLGFRAQGGGWEWEVAAAKPETWHFLFFLGIESGF